MKEDKLKGLAKKCREHAMLRPEISIQKNTVTPGIFIPTSDSNSCKKENLPGISESQNATFKTSPPDTGLPKGARQLLLLLLGVFH
ncbi:hypothetical protein [Foetidibacter luteolus]|uniref:hypothetical protein n=1 Tax=Foetidibacter luteolus TaxID=2608880 RepID=UPI00129B0867|nr:hypothetical protein [Foetidibacter luteolus]